MRRDGTRVIGESVRPTNPARGPDAIVDELVAMCRDTIAQVGAEEPGASVVGMECSSVDIGAYSTGRPTTCDAASARSAKLHASSPANS